MGALIVIKEVCGGPLEQITDRLQTSRPLIRAAGGVIDFANDPKEVGGHGGLVSISERSDHERCDGKKRPTNTPLSRHFRFGFAKCH
jgi:hypothetical protein